MKMYSNFFLLLLGLKTIVSVNESMLVRLV